MTEQKFGSDPNSVYRSIPFVYYSWLQVSNINNYTFIDHNRCIYSKNHSKTNFKDEFHK